MSFLAWQKSKRKRDNLADGSAAKSPPHIATLELDDAGAIISYEEYYPYGSISFQSGRSTAEVSLKRYRYTGKERDEETGLYYHGARYYIPWLARWSASDPMEAKYAGMSPYNYSMNNPVMLNDPSGADSDGEQMIAVNTQSPTYSFTQNTYNHSGTLLSSATSNFFDDRFAPGEYIQDVSFLTHQDQLSLMETLLSQI